MKKEGNEGKGRLNRDDWCGATAQRLLERRRRRRVWLVRRAKAVTARRGEKGKGGGGGVTQKDDVIRCLLIGRLVASTRRGDRPRRRSK